MVPEKMEGRRKGYERGMGQGELDSGRGWDAGVDTVDTVERWVCGGMGWMGEN